MNNQLKSYLITDPSFYTNQAEDFKKILFKSLNKHTVDIACFRDKQSSNFAELASIFVKECKQSNIENIFINSDYKLAKSLDATGVHLTSTQFNEIEFAKELNLDIIVSCHNIHEIEKAIEAKVDTITYSPIFFSPNKGVAKGIEDLESIIKKYPKLRIIALGGIINDDHIKLIKKTNAYAFASIRYFV